MDSNTQPVTSANESVVPDVPHIDGIVPTEEEMNAPKPEEKKGPSKILIIGIVAIIISGIILVVLLISRNQTPVTPTTNVTPTEAVVEDLTFTDENYPDLAVNYTSDWEVTTSTGTTTGLTDKELDTLTVELSKGDALLQFNFTPMRKVGGAACFKADEVAEYEVLTNDWVRWIGEVVSTYSNALTIKDGDNLDALKTSYEEDWADIVACGDDSVKAGNSRVVTASTYTEPGFDGTDDVVLDVFIDITLTVTESVDEALVTEADAIVTGSKF